MNNLIIFSSISFFYLENLYIAKYIDVLLYLYVLFCILTKNLTIPAYYLNIVLLGLVIAAFLGLSEAIRGYPKSSFLPIIQICIAMAIAHVFVAVRNNESLLAVWRISTALAVFLFFSQVARAISQDANSVIGVMFEMRLIPGLNNLGNSIIAYSTISTFSAVQYYRKTLNARYLYVNLFLIVIVLIYPSRQTLIAAIILLIILLYYFRQEKIVFAILALCMSSVVYFFIQLGIIEFVVQRFMNNIELGNSYSRIRQYELAWQIFREYPIFGTQIDPYPMLDMKNLHVFESSWSDLAVRNGLLGLILILFLIYLFLIKVRIATAVFIIPLLMMTLFNETLLQEELWFTLSLLANIDKNYMNQDNKL